MKLSKRDIGLIVVLLGIAAFLVCYLAVYTPNIEKNDNLRAEISALKPELDALNIKKARQPEFEEGIRQSKETITSISEGFPNQWRPEDDIMYAVELENVLGIDTGNISFRQNVLLEEIDEIIAPDGEVEFEAKQAYKSSVTYDINLTYQQMMEIIKHVYGRSNKATVDEVSVSFNSENGILFGTLSVGKFFMTSPSDEYVETYVPSMPVGVENPFRTLPEVADFEDLEDLNGDGVIDIQDALIAAGVIALPGEEED